MVETFRWNAMRRDRFAVATGVLCLGFLLAWSHSARAGAEWDSQPKAKKSADAASGTNAPASVPHASTRSAAATAREDGAITEEPRPQDQAAVVIDITDRLRFEPSPVEIQAGQVVKWHNASVLVHTVTADPGLATIEGSASLPTGAAAFNSGNLEPEAVFLHRFDVPGSYQYFCIPHEAAKMIGRVIVHAAGSR